MFFPLARWRLVWEIIHLCAVICFFFYMPLYLVYTVSFGDVFQFNAAGLLISCLLSLDVLLNVNTAQFSKGVLLQSRYLIFKYYMKHDGVLAVLFSSSSWIVTIAES